MAKKTAQSSALSALRAQLREKTPERLYIFYGEETFLLQHYLDQLRKLLVDEVTESFNFHKLTNENFEILALADAVENLPMMAEHTMVWVDEIDLFKRNESEREKIIDIFSDIPDYCTVVFTYESTEWKPDKRQKKLWEAIENNGMIVEFPKQEQRELISWVTRHFSANGKQITPQLCAYLIEITGGTMTVLAGEISKICAFSGADAITKSDIDAVTEPVLDAVVFQMTDMLGQGAYGPALLKLRTLLKMQQEPIAILGAVGAHFRRLGTAKTLMDQGRNSADLMRLCGMADYAARKMMDAAKRFSSRFCATACELVMETDRKLKTSYDAPDRLLELLILQLAQEAKNG